MKIHITKDTFELIYIKCMNVDKAPIFNCDENGKVHISECDIIPYMIITDFSNPNYPMCEKEFNNYDDIGKIYEYFLSLNGYCRVMDATGNIYLDYYE